MLRLGSRLCVVALLPVLPSPADAQTNTAPITLTLGCHASAPDPGVEFVLSLSNAGDTDTAVVLGHVQGGLPIGMKNVYVVRGLELSVDRGNTGDAERFKFMPRIAVVAGWLDEWLVPLPVDATYTLSVKADRFYSATNWRRLDVSTRATIRVLWQIRATEKLNYEVWSGQLTSNTIAAPDGCTPDSRSSVGDRE